MKVSCNVTKNNVTIDKVKRQRVMQRSMKLGHCICDPKKACPCDTFKNKDVCPCAGERVSFDKKKDVKLTELVHNPGCASKIAAKDLERFLAKLPKINDPRIISGIPAGDDAGIYKIDDNTTLVQTIDVFTPCVDDPYMFGKICAANCLSDIYAMGGTPKTALSILAFPSETQNGEIMYEMLKGAMEMLKQAQCSLLGGHSIKDEEIKLGFAITGTIKEQKSISLSTAKIGDMLVLTKPLGVGVLNFANQIGRTHKSGLKQSQESMMKLNKDAAEIMIKTGVSACTDITGFGLFGHLIRMLRHSHVSALIDAESIPAFDGAIELLKDDVIPGAIERNKEFVGEDLVVSDGLEEELINIGFDAQTSGGLLISVSKEKHKALIDGLNGIGLSPASIGEIKKGDGCIQLNKSGANSRSQKQVKSLKKVPESSSISCCCDSVDSKNTVSGSVKAFGDLMRSTSGAGSIDERTKELIIFSLVILSRCEGCIDVHYEKAIAMGITRQELDEAAWCAIAMGGAPVKMFYSQYLASKKQK